MKTLIRAMLAAGLTLVVQHGLAQTLPVNVAIAGDTAHATIGPQNDPLADLILTFDDVTGLSTASLGISAQLVSPTDPTLLARLPDPTSVSLPTAISALITIEPPLTGGLSFDRVVTVEIDTELLQYTAGSPFRVFKAPLNGDFRDITREVSPGSVRARSGTGSFSQFMIVADLRASEDVIEEKLSWLYQQVATLGSSDRDELEPMLDDVADAVDAELYNDASGVLDLFTAYVSENAGSSIPEEWAATRNKHNAAGELLSGAASLKFSIAFLRDYGI